MDGLNRQDIEINEAIVAGNHALSALDRAEQQLNSARGWGIWDMFGGGMISSAIKHSKVDDAQRSLNEAHRALQRFSRELNDVQTSGYLQINFDGLTQFFDIFCDNLFVDILVQSEIKRAQESVAETKRRVRDALAQLSAML